MGGTLLLRKLPPIEIVYLLLFQEKTSFKTLGPLVTIKDFLISFLKNGYSYTVYFQTL